jgi:hypothetical protein
MSFKTRINSKKDEIQKLLGYLTTPRKDEKLGIKKFIANEKSSVFYFRNCACVRIV